jgi:hypothetical protein
MNKPVVMTEEQFRSHYASEGCTDFVAHCEAVEAWRDDEFIATWYVVDGSITEWD